MPKPEATLERRVEILEYAMDKMAANVILVQKTVATLSTNTSRAFEAFTKSQRDMVEIMKQMKAAKK
jgi:hypothetical protein